MNPKLVQILITLIILLKFNLVFAEDVCINKAIFFGDDGDDITLKGNACYYKPQAGNGESALFGGKGGNVKVENGAIVIGGIKAGKGGYGIKGGDGGNIIIKDINDGKSGDIYGKIEAGDGGSGLFKSGKGGNINNIDYKKNIDDKK